MNKPVFERVRSVAAPIVLGLVLTGCSHQLSLHPRNGGAPAVGVANEIGYTVQITHEGKVFNGRYTYDGGSVATFQSFGSATAFSGVNSATAFGNSFGTSYIPGSGNGRIFANSVSGESIRCEFNYRTGGGLGVCQSSSGEIFDLVIHN